MTPFPTASSIRPSTGPAWMVMEAQEGTAGRDGLSRLVLPVMRLLEAAGAALEQDRVAAGSLISRAVGLLRDGERAAGQRRPEPATGGLAPWQVRRLEAHIDAHLEDRIAVGDLAPIVRLSVGHLSRAFKRSFGTAPHAYIIRRRVERAQELMLSTDEPLCQIALACGLANQAHFSRLFQRHVGTSPGAWRRQHRSRPPAAAAAADGRARLSA